MEGVSRRFGAAWALRDVDLRVDRGEIVALTGRNGAGKSTLLRIAATLDEPTRGRRAIAGLDARADPAGARRHIAWSGPDPGLYGDLTVRENLAFAASFHRRGDRVAPMADALGLTSLLPARARTLSRGEAQRAALARAMLMGDLVLLDEPTTGLDEDGARRLAALLEAERPRAAILLATHDEALAGKCDRRVRLVGGAIT